MPYCKDMKGDTNSTFKAPFIQFKLSHLLSDDIRKL